MDTNKSLANTHFVIDNSIYMKSSNNSNKYVSVIKLFKRQRFDVLLEQKAP